MYIRTHFGKLILLLSCLYPFLFQTEFFTSFNFFAGVTSSLIVAHYKAGKSQLKLPLNTADWIFTRFNIKVKKLGYDRRLIYKQPHQGLGLCITFVWRCHVGALRRA